MDSVIAIAVGVLVGALGALVAVWSALAFAMFVAVPRSVSLEEVLRLLPDTVRLLRGLATDVEVPRAARTRLWLLFAYLAVPFDLVPDFIPVLGQLDDAVVACLTLRSVARIAGVATLRRHWPGTESGFAALCGAAGLPPASAAGRKEAGALTEVVEPAEAAADAERERPRG